MRRVAAEARRVLLDMASAQLGVPVAQLAVSDGVVSATNDASKKVTYGQLIGGKRFNVTLTGANTDATTGVAKIKPVQDLKIVGTSPQRYDIPGKVDGSVKWAVGVKVPGMVHARNVRPPFAGAKLVSVDESSVRSIPGFVKVVTKGNYVAVVCEREEQAIKAARQLKATWQRPATAPFPASEDLFKYMRAATPDVQRAAGRGRRRGGRAVRRRESGRGGIRRPVSGPHVDRPGARDGRSVQRSDDDLLERHEVVRPAQRRRAVPRHPARSCPRRLDGRAAGLRPHGGRRCRVRGGVSGERAGTPGARAVDAPGGNGVGHERSRLHVQDPRRSRRAGQRRRPRLRGARRRSQSRRLQRARHGPHRAADGPAEGHARSRRQRRADRDLRHPEPAPRPARRLPAARVGDAAPDRQPARPQRSADGVRHRVVHRRDGGGREDGPGGVPAEARQRRKGRQRVQEGPVDRRHRGGREGLRLGRAPVAEGRRSAETS